MFRNASQNSSESLDSYYTRLRRLAQTCKFTNEDEEIKSHIIVSSLSSWLRRRALREDMDLEALLDYGHGLQMSNKQGPTAWVSPIVVAPKKTGIRISVDMRAAM